MYVAFHFDYIKARIGIVNNSFLVQEKNCHKNDEMMHLSHSLCIARIMIENINPRPPFSQPCISNQIVSIGCGDHVMYFVIC